MKPYSTNQNGDRQNELDKYVRDMTLEFISSVQRQPPEIKQNALEILLRAMDNIINHPYIDKHRIINLNSESWPVIFKQPFAISFFMRIGFIEEFVKNQQLFYYCYNCPTSTIKTVQRTLREAVRGYVGNTSGTNYEKVDILHRTTFDNFLRFRTMLSQDLLKKDSRQERVAININLDEMRTIYDRMKLRSIQDILLTYYRDPVSLERELKNIIPSIRRTDSLMCKD